MEEPELIEADFQQYYHIDFDREFLDADGSRRGFRRFARLFNNLPPESRTIKHYAPEASWSWEEEMLSRILHQMETLCVLTHNINRKKGARALQPGEQFQPDYVKEFKQREQKQSLQRQKQEIDLEATKAFWSQRNPEAHSTIS